MNWLHALLERARRRRATPSGLIAGPDPQMSAEQRAYLLASIIGRAPGDVLDGLHGPAVHPPVPVTRYVDLGAHCSCWTLGSRCCSCAQGACPATLDHASRRTSRDWRREYEGRWTPDEEDEPRWEAARRAAPRTLRARLEADNYGIRPPSNRRGPW